MYSIQLRLWFDNTCVIFFSHPLSQEVLQPGTHSDSEFGRLRYGDLNIEPKVVGGITSLQRQNRDAFSKKTCITCEATNVATQRVSLLHHPTFNSQRSSCGSKSLWSLMVVAPNFLPKMLGTWGTDTSNCSSHKEPCPNNTLLQDNTRCRNLILQWKPDSPMTRIHHLQMLDFPLPPLITKE